MSNRLLLLATLMALAVPASAQDSSCDGGVCTPRVETFAAPADAENGCDGGVCRPYTPPLRTEPASLHDDPSAPTAFRAPQAVERDLPSGRDGTPASQSVTTFEVSVDAPLNNGRPAPGSPEAAALAARLASLSAVSFDGPLDNGRPPGTRPATVAVAQQESVTVRAASEAVEASAVWDDAYPNPTAGRVAVTFRTAVALRADVSVYDLRGRLVQKAYDAVVAADVDNRVDIDLSDVAAGSYVIVLTAGDARHSQTIQVIR